MSPLCHRLIQITRTEWSPAEFLQQGTKVDRSIDLLCGTMKFVCSDTIPFILLNHWIALGPIRGANTDAHKKEVLALNDTFGSTKRVDHTTSLLKQMNLEETLHTLGLDVEKEPLEGTAKVLEAPEVSFRNQSSVRVQDGSWNLRDADFKRASELHSFVVIDLTCLARDIMPGVLKALKRHKVGLPTNIDPFAACSRLVVRPSRPVHLVNENEMMGMVGCNVECFGAS